MEIYFAPMEGITGYLYRNVHNKYYNGIAAYYAPFITTTKNGVKKTKEIRDILPENNQEILLVPQLLTNQAEQYLEYEKVIADLWEMEHFFDQVFAKNQLAISVKTRIGTDSPEEFADLMDVYRRYPLKNLIIHPRTQSDYYKNHPNLDAFRIGLEKSACPVCYNGDIRTVEDLEHLHQQFPQLEHVMIGRGLLTDPALAEKLETANAEGNISSERFRAFHDELYSEYQSAFSGEKPVLFKMKELWVYWGEQFPGEEKALKQIRKAQRLADYESAARYLLY